jgi:hypothetical protein
MVLHDVPGREAPTRDLAMETTNGDPPHPILNCDPAHVRHTGRPTRWSLHHIRLSEAERSPS